MKLLVLSVAHGEIGGVLQKYKSHNFILVKHASDRM